MQCFLCQRPAQPHVLGRAGRCTQNTLRVLLLPSFLPSLSGMKGEKRKNKLVMGEKSGECSMLRGQMESNKIHNLFFQEKFFSRGKEQRKTDCSSDLWRDCPWICPGTATALPKRCPEAALALFSLSLVLRNSREASGKVSVIQAEPQPDAWPPRMSSAGCRMTPCIPGTEGAWSFVMDFRENCLCVWSRSAKSAGGTAFVSKWHLKGLNYFSGVETFI